MRWTLPLVLALLPALGLRAQPAAPEPLPFVHDAWRTGDGLPHGTVSALLQTRDGYLWIGTAAGLARFNSHRFALVADAAAPHLEYAYVWALHEDADGTLWVGTGDGLTRMGAADTTTYTTADGLPFNFIHALARDADGRLWAGTYGGGACHLADGGFTCYGVDDGLPDPFVNALWPEPDGTLWVATDGGLGRWHGARFEAVPLPPAARQVKALWQTADTLWLGTGDGLYRLRDGAAEPVRAAGRALGPVRTLLADADGTLWVGTETAGLYRLRGGALRPLSADVPLGSSDVRALAQDHEGSLWVGTNGDGLTRLKRGRVRVYGTPEGLPADHVHTVLESSSGAVWVATGSGLARLDGGRAETFGTGDGLPSGRVLSLAESASGALWVGTDGGGLSRYADGAFTTFTAADGLPSDAIYSLYIGPEGDLWVGTNRGLSRYADGAFTTFTAADGLADGIVVTMATGADGALWIGADGGLSRYADGAFTTFTTADGLPTDLIRALHVDATGTLWIGTRGGGLVRLQGGTFTTFSTAHGLPDAIIFRILEDDGGALWLSTARRGLVRVAKRDLDAVAAGQAARVTPLVIDRADGLRSPEANGGYHPAGWKARDGRLWFPTHIGVAVVDPARVDGAAPPPPVRIEQVLVDGRPVPVSDGTVTLPARTNRVEIHYAGLSFLDPLRLQFRYRLGDGAWAVTRQRTQAYNLQPGAYTFEVAAAHAGGAWSDPPTALALSLPPPWWRTWWAYGVYALAIGLLFSGFVSWRVWDLRRRNEALEALVRERTAQVATQAERLQRMDEVKSRFFANLSHEFRTPLTLILGPLDDALRPDRPAAPDPDAWAVMRRQARRLLRLIDQLLDLAKLEAGRLPLRARRGDLVGFLQDVVLSFAPAADAKGLTLEFHAEPERLDLFFDAHKLEQVFYNLLANALKFTDAGGKVHVGVGRAEGEEAAEVTVRDTGTGIPPDQLDHIFDRFHQSEMGGLKGTGIGLALVREFVHLHGGAVWAESAVGFGSTFTVRLPLGRAHLAPEELAPEALADDDAPAEAAPSGDAAPPLEALVEPEVVETPAVRGADVEAPLVLVVEDDADVRAYLRRCLAADFCVLEAADGAEGLARARETTPDLIISDVMMPEMDGFELTRRLKADEALRHLPLILLTARASAEARLEGLEAGADDYLAKPFNAEELVARARNMVAARQHLRARFSDEVVVRPSDVVVPSADAAFLQRAVDVVEAHLDDSLFGVDTLAAEVGLSPRQLQRKLRDLTDEAPSHFIRRIRLERAAQLLRQQAGTVSEIAYAVGFSKPAYFSKLFAEAYGVPPSIYAAEAAD